MARVESRQLRELFFFIESCLVGAIFQNWSERHRKLSLIVATLQTANLVTASFDSAKLAVRSDFFFGFLAGARGLGVGDDFFGHFTGDEIVMVKLHAVAGATLGHGGEAGGIVQHF